jgi:hypothetical protein
MWCHRLTGHQRGRPALLLSLERLSAGSGARSQYFPLDPPPHVVVGTMRSMDPLNHLYA